LRVIVNNEQTVPILVALGKYFDLEVAQNEQVTSDNTWLRFTF